MGYRREGYLRLPFVDDQCLRSTMQGFLTREISRKARLTRTNAVVLVSTFPLREDSLALPAYSQLSITLEAYTRSTLDANPVTSS